MQYWIYGHRYSDEDEIVGVYDSYEEASDMIYALDENEYEYADLFEMEWEKEPVYLATVVFNYERDKVLIK